MTVIVAKDTKFISLLRNNYREFYHARKRKPEDKIHVSDILPSSCLRKAFYSRISKEFQLTDEDIDNFVRGESSEYALVNLANIGVGQYELQFEDDLIARPDLMTDKEARQITSQNIKQKDEFSADIIVEFKDTKSMVRLTPENLRFRSYLRQLLYYLVISNYDTGILCIRYANNRNLIWLKSDSAGDYYFSPKASTAGHDSRLPDIETWTVIMQKDSPIREMLKDEIRMRVKLLRFALRSGSVAELPKVSEEWKCIRCPFLKDCNPNSVKKKDSKIDPLDKNGMITVLPA